MGTAALAGGLDISHETASPGTSVTISGGCDKDRDSFASVSSEALEKESGHVGSDGRVSIITRVRDVPSRHYEVTLICNTSRATAINDITVTGGGSCGFGRHNRRCDFHGDDSDFNGDDSDFNRHDRCGFDRENRECDFRRHDRCGFDRECDFRRHDRCGFDRECDFHRHDRSCGFDRECDFHRHDRCGFGRECDFHRHDRSCGFGRDNRRCDPPREGAMTGGGGTAGGPGLPAAPVGLALLAGATGVGGLTLLRARSRGRV
ncbi:MAG: hypothetical protein JWN00_4065 [Actinomycetia bacterium]|nr:hypothetical protein [Actinomycetes bacterium]